MVKKMGLKPLNRHILLEKIALEEIETEQPKILLPEDYSIAKSPYDVYKVLAIAEDCEKLSQSDLGCAVLVNNSMVENATYNKETYYLLLENYVYGIYE